MAQARDAAKTNVRLKQQHEETYETIKQAIIAKLNRQRSRGGKADDPRLEHISSASYKCSFHN